MQRFVLGPLFVLGGLWFFVMAFGLAEMNFGGRDTPPGWGEYLGVVVTHGFLPLSIGLALLIVGMYLAAPRGSSIAQADRVKKL